MAKIQLICDDQTFYYMDQFDLDPLQGFLVHSNWS